MATKQKSDKIEKSSEKIREKKRIPKNLKNLVA